MNTRDDANNRKDGRNMKSEELAWKIRRHGIEMGQVIQAENGTQYFVCGNNRIKISEHFAACLLYTSRCV